MMTTVDTPLARSAAKGIDINEAHKITGYKMFTDNSDRVTMNGSGVGRT
jgi:hypothetical protein